MYTLEISDESLKKLEKIMNFSSNIFLFLKKLVKNFQEWITKL